MAIKVVNALLAVIGGVGGAIVVFYLLNKLAELMPGRWEDRLKPFLWLWLRTLIGDSATSHSVIVGTAADSPTSARTYLRARHGSEDAIVTLVWAGDRLIGLEDGGRAAYPLRLRASGDDALVSFDLFSGHLVRVTMVADRELVIESNGVTRRVVR